MIDMDMAPAPPNKFLMAQLKETPYMRGLLRSLESSYYQEFELTHPIYDVGCGDGQFASLTFDHKIDVGLDPWEDPIRDAPTFGSYEGLVVADGAVSPFPSNHFASAVSNSVLEHIPNVEDVLRDTGRVLKSGALFLFCVPNEAYYTELLFARLFRKLGLSRLAKTYTNWFGFISRTEHANSPEVWHTRLEKAGFELERWWHYFSPSALRALELGHYLGLPAYIVKKVFGRWLLSPTDWNLALTERLLRKYSNTDHIVDGTYTFFVARKK